MQINHLIRWNHFERVCVLSLIRAVILLLKFTKGYFCMRFTILIATEKNKRWNQFGYLCFRVVQGAKDNKLCCYYELDNQTRKKYFLAELNWGNYFQGYNGCRLHFINSTVHGLIFKDFSPANCPSSIVVEASLRNIYINCENKSPTSRM